MDLTWTLYRRGWKVRFVPEAACYPIEPYNLDLLRKQVRRWSHGFVQNVKLHWRGVLGLGYLRSMVALAFWDSAIASVAYLFAIPLLALLVGPSFWLGYVVDAPVLLVPVLVDALRRGETRRALASFPAYFPLRVANAAMMLKAVVLELVLRRPPLVYGRGTRVSAGLPGAGLAGLFFILSAILAVPIELVRTVSGRSSRQAWLGVGRHVGLAVAMIMALEFAFAAVSAITAELSGKRVLPPSCHTYLCCSPWRYSSSCWRRPRRWSWRSGRGDFARSRWKFRNHCCRHHTRFARSRAVAPPRNTPVRPRHTRAQASKRKRE
jgi:hypothetical protein